MGVQLIYTGNEYEIADAFSEAEKPEWPVQDSGARWHWPEFDGQLAYFKGGNVFFGFLAEEIPTPELDNDRLPLVDDENQFRANGKFYQKI